MVHQLDHQSHLILASDGDQVVLRPANPGRKRIATFGLWQCTFNTFMSIYLQQHTQRYAELLKYCEIVRTVSIQFGGMDWKMYDQPFWLKQERTPSTGRRCHGAMGDGGERAGILHAKFACPIPASPT